MKLKKGITGGWAVNEELISSSSNVSQLKTSLYPIEYTGAFKIGQFKEENICKNYYRLLIIDKFKNSRFDILINSIYPYYCATNPDSFEFIDVPTEILHAADPGFIYLSPVELNAKFNSEDLTELSAGEIKDIKYWKPKTYGEIIFNHWD